MFTWLHCILQVNWKFTVFVESDSWEKLKSIEVLHEYVNKDVEWSIACVDCLTILFRVLNWIVQVDLEKDKKKTILESCSSLLRIRAFLTGNYLTASGKLIEW